MRSLTTKLTRLGADYRFGWPVLLFLLTIVLIALVMSGPPSTAARSLVLITIDTLRADHLHSYGYFRETSPNLDRLAEDALLFERVISPMATTLPSHASIMTSTYPIQHGILSNFRVFRWSLETGDGLQTAAQMLGRAGYQTAAFTSSSPLSKESGIDAGFQTFHGPPLFTVESRRIDVVAEETVDRALAWLESAEGLFFLWVHLFDPHDPYSAPEPYSSAFSDDAELRGLIW